MGLWEWRNANVQQARAESAEMVKSELAGLSERLKERRELLVEIETSFSLPAWRPSGMPRSSSSSFRRQESAVLKATEVREQVNRLERTLNSYIEVLRNAPEGMVRYREEKIRLLTMRYLHGKPWADIQWAIMATTPEGKKSDQRRLMRWHDRATSEIWEYWDRK